MAFADWTTGADAGTTVALTGSSVIQGVSSAYLTTGGGGATRGIAARTVGSAVTTYKVQTAFKVDNAPVAAFIPSVFGSMQGSVAQGSNCYSLGLESATSVTLRKGALGTGASLATATLPYTIIAGTVYAFGLLVQRDSGTGFVFFTMLASPGSVSSTYDYSTMAQIGTVIVDSSSAYSTSLGTGVSVYSTGLGTPAVQLRYDLTEIWVP